MRPATPVVDPAAARRALRTSECWNHNTHYHRFIPRWAPPPWGRALDVGCGEGLLTRRLAPFAAEVAGIDADAAMIARARELAPPNATYVHGDVLAVDRAGALFDLVTCVATLHHLPLAEGLARLRAAVAPGGTLVVIGMARAGSAPDLAWHGFGTLANTPGRLVRGHWEPGAPIKNPAQTYGEVVEAAARILPGARFRHHLYWRYSLVWRAPEGVSRAR